MLFVFFNDTATTEIYTLSLHDALPILVVGAEKMTAAPGVLIGDILLNASYRKEEGDTEGGFAGIFGQIAQRYFQHYGDQSSEEHTSELQSRQYLVCRLLLEKKTNRCVA